MALHKLDESSSRQLSTFLLNYHDHPSSALHFSSSLLTTTLLSCFHLVYGASTSPARPLVCSRSPPSSRHRSPSSIPREPHATLPPISEVRAARMGAIRAFDGAFYAVLIPGHPAQSFLGLLCTLAIH